MNFIKIALIIALIVLAQAPTNAQEWVSFQSQAQINDLVDTGDELIMATDAGLVVMNKTTFEKSYFNINNSNLSNNHIQTIDQGTNGEIWIGTYDAITARFDGSDFVDAGLPEGDFNPLVIKAYDVKVAPNGDLWFGTSAGVFHKEGTDWNQYAEEELGDDFFEVWDIEFGDNDEVFVGAFNVHKFSDGVWSNISEDTPFISYLSAELFLSSTGELYYAGDLDAIGRYNGFTWELINLPEIGGLFNGSQVVKFSEDTDGSIYFNTQYNGVFKLIDNEWIQEENAQTTAYEDQTSYLYIDEENNHWLNKNIHLSVNNNGNIQSTLISSTTLESNSLINIHKGENGAMYFMNYSNDNVAVLDTEGIWSFLPLPNTFSEFEGAEDMLVISENDIWIGTNLGLHHYDGNEWSFNDFGPCRSFALDSQGIIYVRTNSLIYIIDNGAVSAYDTSNSPLSGTYVSGHGIDANDNLWIAEGDINTIHKVSPDANWTTYTADDHPAINVPAGDFHFDINGNVWIPADIVGAIKFDGTNFSNLIAENISEVENYDVHSIQSDAEGKVYCAHQYGITIILDDELGESLIEYVPNSFSSHESTIEMDNNGNLWWASSRYGVFLYTLGIMTSTESATETANDFTIYPNPAVGHTVIDFAIEEEANANVFVYNNLGQLITNTEIGQLMSGTHQHRLDLTNLPKGIYTVQLQINDITSVKRIIIQ